jgi:CheY-like chemotaxis protein
MGARPARRVLVVEVTPTRCGRCWSAGGHEVEVAADGPRGLERALAWRPDVAVLDIGLPPLDGSELARRLRAARPGRGPAEPPCGPARPRL